MARLTLDAMKNFVDNDLCHVESRKDLSKKVLRRGRKCKKGEALRKT